MAPRAPMSAEHKRKIGDALRGRPLSEAHKAALKAKHRGTTGIHPKRTYRPVADRLWARVDRAGGPDACWPWMGARVSSGHGRIRAVRKTVVTSRVAWESVHGPIPDGMEVCHSCDNPPCCNPAHLFLGTQADNATDMGRKGRAAHGSAKRVAKLTEQQVQDIRARYAQGGISQSALAAQFGITQGTIGPLLRRLTWKHVP